MGNITMEIIRPAADNQFCFRVLIFDLSMFFTGLIIKIYGLKDKLNFSLILIIC